MEVPFCSWNMWRRQPQFPLQQKGFPLSHARVANYYCNIRVSRTLVWINGPTKGFIARAGAHELTTTVLSEDQVRDLAEKMLKSSGRRVDLSAPVVDAMLPDGSRLQVVIPDITQA